LYYQAKVRRQSPKSHPTNLANGKKNIRANQLNLCMS